MAGVKHWVHLETLTHDDLNGYLMDQAVPRFADETERDAMIGTPVDGMLCHIAGVGVQLYAGGWASFGGSYTPPLVHNGLATLVAGTVDVSSAYVDEYALIFLTSQLDGGTPGWLRVSARSNGLTFTITSSEPTDTSTVAWQLIST